ncbi:hypothetical protein EJ08DRAFT_695007 [Tothia fuscella]|uniref:Uncharacterized protein n=1 Tax=Tothia fuscella TaxID=1048955 RepID=A0A9P4NWG7_9PEZI|nr:hypothetical protein EJ08DRAFT_695007 [Tothia fuscella]
MSIALYTFTTDLRQALPSCMDLNNPVHPAYERDRWILEGLSEERIDKFWNNTKLARQLATRFLTTESLQGFWLHLMTAAKTLDRKSGISVLEKIPDEASQRWEGQLQDVQLGAVPVKSRMDWSREEVVMQTISKPVISINKVFLVFAVNKYDRKSEHSRQVFQVQFAMVLTHEMAHALCAIYQPLSEFGDINNEPLHHVEDVVPGMGRSWESWLFGVRPKSDFD